MLAVLSVKSSPLLAGVALTGGGLTDADAPRRAEAGELELSLLALDMDTLPGLEKFAVDGVGAVARTVVCCTFVDGGGLRCE